jgi:hypothetical protein
MKPIFFLAALPALSAAAPLDFITDLLRRASVPKAIHYFPSYTAAPAQTSSAPEFRIQAAAAAAVTPQVKSAQVLGLVSDPALSRDSCGSCRIGNRTLWVCRDTQYTAADGSVRQDILLSSSASWSNMTSSVKPWFQPVKSTDNKLTTTVLREYGSNGQSQSFYPWDPAKFCQPPHGGCSDGSRYTLCTSTLPTSLQYPN